MREKLGREIRVFETSGLSQSPSQASGSGKLAEKEVKMISDSG